MDRGPCRDLHKRTLVGPSDPGVANSGAAAAMFVHLGRKVVVAPSSGQKSEVEKDRRSDLTLWLGVTASNEFGLQRKDHTLPSHPAQNALVTEAFS